MILLGGIDEGISLVDEGTSVVEDSGIDLETSGNVADSEVADVEDSVEEPDNCVSAGDAETGL